MRDMALAQIKIGKVGLSAHRIVPTRKKASDIRSMIRRPYMSESFAKSSVTKAAPRDGIEISQAYKAIPFKSAAILGLAIVNVWMKYVLQK